MTIRIYKLDVDYDLVSVPKADRPNVHSAVQDFIIGPNYKQQLYMIISKGLSFNDFYVNPNDENVIEIDFLNDYEFRIFLSDYILTDSNYHEFGEHYRDYVVDLKNHKTTDSAREDAYHAMKMEAEEQCNTIIDKYQTASIVFSQKLTIALYILERIERKEDIKFDLELTFAREAKREKKTVEKIAKNIVREYKIVGALHDALNDVVINTIKFIDDTVVTDDDLTEVDKSMRINELVQGAKDQMKIDYEAIVNPPKVKVKKPVPKPAETTPVDEAPVPDVSGESNDE